MSIHETVLKENSNNLYWWSKWPKNPSDKEQEIIDFILKYHPNTITIGIQKVADLILEFSNKT